MLDAYLGTIDYDGETIDEARAEVAGYLDGSPLLEHSFVGMVEGSIVSACLVGTWEHGPLIGYMMTAAEHKSRGLASHLLDHSLAALAEAGEAEVSAWITEGNLPSERIFLRAGFERRQAREDR